MADHAKTLDISWETILKIAVAAGFFYVLYLLRNILIWVIFALIISVLFDPAVNFLKKFMPRILAVILIYVSVFGIIGMSIYLVAPLFVKEINQFSQDFPTYFERISPVLSGLGIEAFDSFEKFIGTIQSQLSGISSNIFSAIGAIFGGLFSTITILTISLFLSLEEKGLEKVVGALSPKKYEAVVLSLLGKSQKKVAGWFGSKILSSIFISLLTFLICYVLNIQYAISFGLFAGVFNLIPIIGPVISGAIIGIIVAANSWLKAAFFIAAFVLTQQIEGNILTPVLTKKFIGLSPALVIIALLVGGKLWGFMGAFLAIPIAGILFEFVRDFLKKKKEEKAVVL
ncbi:MAG: AI-2E family transporter [Candidatus Nealsonbacteria bacterium]|nr:AI-2E family transporter [Candidatus Nealsonbacteria bacterium]